MGIEPIEEDRQRVVPELSLTGGPERIEQQDAGWTPRLLAMTFKLEDEDCRGVRQCGATRRTGHRATLAHSLVVALDRRVRLLFGILCGRCWRQMVAEHLDEAVSDCISHSLVVADQRPQVGIVYCTRGELLVGDAETGIRLPLCDQDGLGW